MNLIIPRDRRIIIPNDDTGKPTGYQTEHWDDSIDATVLSPKVAIRAADHISQEELLALRSVLRRMM